MSRSGLLLALAGLGFISSHAVFASTLNSVVWNPDTTVNGTGTGTLDGLTVTYDTVSGDLNAGEEINLDWSTNPATMNFGPYSSETGGVLGTETGSPDTQTISFTGTGTLINPILLVDFSDAGTSMSFSGLTINPLEENHAQFSGTTVTFNGSSNQIGDGFAMMVLGTFGAGNPISFTYSANGAGDQTVGFTLVALPEPSSFVLSLAGLAALCLVSVFARKRAELPSRPR